MKLLLAAILITIILVGCVPDPGTQIDYTLTNSDSYKITHTITRVIDYDAQVVCFTFDSNQDSAGGIHCMPISDTALPRE